MTRVIRLAVLACVVLVLPRASSAAILIYEANLNGFSESPPNPSPGTGFAEVTIDIILNTMRVQVTFSGLLGPRLHRTSTAPRCCLGPGRPGSPRPPRRLLASHSE
jgi:hypothetical protein